MDRYSIFSHAERHTWGMAVASKERIDLYPVGAGAVAPAAHMKALEAIVRKLRRNGVRVVMKNGLATQAAGMHVNMLTRRT